MAEDTIKADKLAGTYSSNLASDAKYYLWQSEFQTRPMGMENRPEAYARLLRDNLPDINTIRIPFNKWSFDEDGSLDPMFERFLTEASLQGFKFVLVYADGETQRLGHDGGLDISAVRAKLTGSVHSRMMESWGKLLDWLDNHSDVKSSVYALEVANEPASYDTAEALSGQTGEFVQLYGDHMAEAAILIDARSDARIMIGGWAYSSLFNILAETRSSINDGSVLDQIRTAAGGDLVWSAHLYPSWATGAGQDIEGMAALVRQRYGVLGPDDLLITETNVKGFAVNLPDQSDMAFWMARAYEVFSEAGIGLGWFPGAEAGDSSFLTINNGKRINFQHPDSYAHGMNGFLLGLSDPRHSGAENISAAMLIGKVYSEEGIRLLVDGLGYAAGHGGNDTLSGVERAINMLYGGTGDDVLIGTSGSDHLFGQADNDTLIGRAGDDVLLGGDGNDVLDGGSGSNILTGGRGADYFLLSNGGTDILTDFRHDLGDQITIDGHGWSMTALLEVGTVLDYDGDGLQDDLVLSWAGGQAILLNQLRSDGIVQGTDGDDSIAVGYRDAAGDTFTWQGSWVQGLDGNDTIIGSISDDTLEGGRNDDVLAGRSGNDVLIGGDGQDSLYGNDGDDTLEGGSGSDQLFGDGGNDLVSGGTGDDIIIGAAGRDTLNGGDGNDTIDGGNDHDVIMGGSGDDSLRGSEGNDTISGGIGSDVISGGYGRDYLFGEDDGDLIYGNGDDDIIDGGAGDDTLFGSAGNDIITGSTGHDQQSGGDGNDTLSGGGGRDTLYGDNGNDLLIGGDGQDYLDGGLGEDRLEGGAGMDVLTSSMTRGAVKHLIGGSGNDEFIFTDVYASGQAVAYLYDFHVGADEITIDGVKGFANIMSMSRFEGFSQQGDEVAMSFAGDIYLFKGHHSDDFF